MSDEALFREIGTVVEAWDARRDEWAIALLVEGKLPPMDTWPDEPVWWKRLLGFKPPRPIYAFVARFLDGRHVQGPSGWFRQSDVAVEDHDWHSGRRRERRTAG